MGDARILSLVESVIESGSSPEEICASCPDLLPEVRRRLRAYRLLEDRLDALLPASDRSDCDSISTALPNLPGYEVLSTLGRGGMGVVFLGRHLKLERRVAIKMLLSGAYAGAIERERFLREARSLATLRHPHIVSVHDVGESEGRPYFTMEHLEGGTLAERLAGKPKPHDEAVRMTLTLADAVSHAHRHGIIHRDLKPANILLDGEGALKISDFGIARSSRADQSLTLTGARMGTPSYMAPEQALGNTDEIGPATDVYALGAILYELLTGRPPFRGATLAETERQLLHEEPAPPRLLNAGVPRDVETICLTCLRKPVARRYHSADDLAADLRRYLAGQPILARAIGPLERSVKWIRRRPGTAAVIAASVVFLCIAAGAAFRAASLRSASVAAITLDLEEAAQHQRRGDWAQAQAALERAKVRLGPTGSTALRRRFERTEADLHLVERLDAIRLLHAGTEQGVINARRARDEYAKVFLEAGLGDMDDSPEAVAERIRSSPIARVLIEALDDWTISTSEPSLRAWLTDILRLADHDDDPMGWRRRARALTPADALEAFIELADEAPVTGQPLPFLYAFGQRLQAVGADPLPFLRRAQRAHPGDFWLTSSLANALRREGSTAEALEYYRAAAALRPDTMASHYNLGTTLGVAGRRAEATESLREAVRLDPDALDPLKAFGLALALDDRHAEALDVLLGAAARDPEDPGLGTLLAFCLTHCSRYDEALTWHDRAVAADPARAMDRWDIRLHLLARGQHAHARSVWTDYLAALPIEIGRWDGYPELCLFLGETDEYERSRRILLEHFADLEDPTWCERAARACLLLPPASSDDLERALRLAERALASESSPSILLTRGLAAYRAGDFATAAEIAEGDAAQVLPPMPRLIAALARRRLGEREAAMQHLAAASTAFDWSAARADTREALIYHVLRREAEGLLLPDLETLITGDRAPRDETERLALLGACRASERCGRWSQLWEESEAARESAPREVPTHVARTLVLAASGAGIDADRYTDADRDRWRSRALALLLSHLDAYEYAALRQPDEYAEIARQALTAWRDTPEFAGVRDPDRLLLLPEEQRRQWHSFWLRVGGITDAAASGDSPV